MKMATPKPVPKPESKDKKPEAPPELPLPGAKPKRRKLIIIAALASTLVLAAAGGAAWYLARPKNPAEATAAPAPAAKPKGEKAKPAIFVALETFTVNLQPESGDRYLQTTLSLKVADPAAEQAIKQQMPEIRSRLLLVLSSKRASELTSIEGKQALANQIAAQINHVLNPGAAPPPPLKSPEPAAAPAQKAAEAGAPTADKAPEAAAPVPPEPASDGPVLSVLFTNFIIQ